MREIELNGTWHLENDAGQQYTAHVPGCVHTDLYSEDEMFRDWNSEHCRWIEQHDWSYTREFTLTPEDISEEAGIPELLFEGLDTYCEIRLNDVLVGTAENMFIPHRFCVKGRLRAGVNTLCVRFHSPVHAVADRPPRSGAFTTERLYTRRMQCSYGWDWVDRFVTCGIYRPVRLLWHKASELEHVSIVTEHLDAWGAQLKITAQLRHNHTSGAQIFMQILSPDGAVVYKNRCFSAEELAVWYVDLAKPALWYPRPYGAQPLYTLRMEVGGQCAEQRFGVRTLRILQTQDTKPADIQRCHALQATPSGHEYDENTTFSCFTPVVNGVKVFCTGANWVPCEPFPSAETPEKITRLLEMAAASNINMIRVWGGGLFEQQHFYDECDRLGLLVCQDFLMACSDYPEADTDFLRQLAQEAETAAYALRNHPCLAWWHGDNENAVNGDDTQEVYPGRIAARRALGPVLERVDPSHRFLPSSPYGGKKYASKTVGTTHNTQFLGTTFSYLEQPELSDYREKWEEYRARFISEEPIFGAVSRSSLSRFLSPQYQSDHDAWLHHTKGNPALSRPLLDMFTEFAQKLFGAFADWDDQYFKMRYLQYELTAIIFDIQRNSFVDGPGIRTTVFFKGCNLKCKWCHNPESQSSKPQILFYKDKCTGCGRCAGITERDTDFVCFNDAKQICGKQYTVDEVFHIVEKDKPFYEASNGGVTFSGGECMLQIDFLYEILKKCKENNIHTAVDTAGFVPWEYFARILPYTDVFLYDIKALNSKIHEAFVGVSNELILSNLKKLFECEASVIIRIPIIPSFNDSAEEMQSIKHFLAPYRPRKIELLPYHKMGEHKYSALGLNMTSFEVPLKESMDKLYAVFN